MFKRVGLKKQVMLPIMGNCFISSSTLIILRYMTFLRRDAMTKN